MKISFRRIGLLGLVFVLIGTSAITINTDKYFEIAKNLEIFTNVYKQLNTHYVEDLDPNQLMRTGIDAMVHSLDPYTVYYSESQVESYRISTEGRYNGLGATSQNIDGKVTISELYEGGPSLAAGLKVGDQISSVNGKSAEGRSYEDVVQFIRGYPGTKLQITVFRPAENKTLPFTITRSEIDIPNVPYYGMVSDNVGYISLTTFTRNAGKNIARSLRTLREENDMRGLILDLRSNGGGLLSEAIDILGIFLPIGSPVVSTKGKVRDRDQNYSTRRMPIGVEFPLVILVNKYSASASEIVAGSIQDFDRGVIMGQRTYGKGLVQNHQEVGYNSRIKITISKYYIPSGRCIQSVEYENGEPKDIDDDKREIFYTKNKRPVLDGGGVTPDIKIELPIVPEILKTLKEKHWLFKYANEYLVSHPDAPELNTIQFDEYKGLKKYLSDHSFSFQTEEEKALSVLSELDGVKNKELFKTEMTSIKHKIDAQKKDDLDEFRTFIIDEIELELAKRYYLQEGKTRQMLKNDAEVTKAIDLLTNSEEYFKILR